MTRTPRRRDHLEVVAVSEDLAAPAPAVRREPRVDVARRRDLESLHAARERLGVLCLDEHVNVRALDADVHDPEALPERGGDRRFAQRLVHRTLAQVADGLDDAHHDVQRMIRPDRRSRAMTRARAAPARLPPGSLAPPAVAEQLLLHVPLPRFPSPRARLRHGFYITSPTRERNLNAPN